jgi:hypothetical protein
MPPFEKYIMDMGDKVPQTNHHVVSIRQTLARSCKSGKELDNKF